MNKKIITFEANEQSLIKTGGISNYSSNKVSYIEAQFELGENWQGFDAVRAIWYNKAEIIATVLSDGRCTVPYEVLTDKGQVKVNLVGSISENDVLTDRLTSYPAVAFIVDAEAKVNGSNTQPITPSQFEQFVEAVKEDADRAEQGASDAETYANNAETSADNALLYSQNAEGSAIRASGYALDAQGYAQNAETAKDEAEDARDEIRNMSANATTLPSGSDATASYSDGVLSLGIPQGIQGEKGDNGDTGATPNLTIGTVETLEPTESATATITGTDENPVLNLGLPKGEQGEVTQAQLDVAVSDLKSEINQVEDLLIDNVPVTVDKTTVWNVGLLAPDGGAEPSLTGYRYSDQITVKAGDVISVRKYDDSGAVGKATRITAYVNGVANASLGEGDDYTLPWTVPNTVTSVAFTLPAAYVSEGSPFYRIITTEAKPKPNTIKEVVTQIEQITSVQKQVIESQIEVVSSARNAANHGVLPSNDGTTNFTNLQSLLDVGGTIVVDVPGVYEINGMLKIGSDTELIFGKQVYMKQTNNTGGFIVNVGASTGVYNSNITIRGLNLICNGMTGDSGVYKTGLRGKIAFYCVKNVLLDGIYVDDIPSATYFIHIARYENFTIQNCHIEGNKDGVHSACGKHLTISNCYFDTADDPIALNCQDYPSSIPYYGWIKDVLIENCIDASPAGTNNAPRARSILLYGGAWLDWESGNYYRNGDTVVASNGFVYRLISATAISDATAIKSTVEPTHSSGNVTESDGCQWRFVQEETVYNVACENVVIRDFYVKCPRVEVLRFHNDDSQYTRSIYPNAIMPPHKNITIDNICIDDEYAASYFVGSHEPVDLIRTVNSKIRAIYMYRIDGEYTVSNDNSTTNLAIVGNDFYRGAAGGMVLVLMQMDGRIVNAKTYGNYKTDGMGNSVSHGTCNMLANDLF